MIKLIKNLFTRIVKRIKRWNDYWAFIENERMKAMEYCGRGFF